ncbi:hypothetical protein [Shinella sp.]|uniref:hypothetical protein n=1 Tax=Shinella sp. TaxID=1870904 RepID=UPI002896A2FD|nr:hypothetical protein [Shinella sp.]
MVQNIDGLEAQLTGFDKLAQKEMQERYRKVLEFLLEHVEAADGRKRIGAARALVLAHGFAARYYLKFGTQIDSEAFPGDGQKGDGPAHRMKAAGYSPQVQNLEDDLFEYVVARHSGFRKELLILLNEGWIGAVLKP